LRVAHAGFRMRSVTAISSAFNTRPAVVPAQTRSASPPGRDDAAPPSAVRFPRARVAESVKWPIRGPRCCRWVRLAAPETDQATPS
jgi:hypothetical protein